MKKNSAELWIWRFFAFRLPADWEMLSFSRELETGRCAFADRRNFRFEVNWRQVKGPPDFDRMLSDYAAKLADDDAGKPSRLSRASWKGLAAEVDGLFTTRFGRYFGDRKCLLELVFLWPDKHDQDLETSVLTSVASMPCIDGNPQRWRAFGMDIAASPELPLAEVNVRPANVEMIFGDPTRGRCETFKRLGLVAEWLDAPLTKWIGRAAPSGMTFEKARSADVHGHDVEQLVCFRNLAPVRRALGLRRYYEAAAWICPRDKRLYHAAVSHIGRTALNERPFAGRILSCCERTALNDQA